MADYVSPRAQQAAHLVGEVNETIVSWIQAADDELSNHVKRTNDGKTALVQPHSTLKLRQLLNLMTPNEGLGQMGLLNSVEAILKYSVNTFCPGFLDKLVACTNPAGLASELLLASLNTNLHVYHVSPALTIVEKHVTKELAKLFGFSHKYRGGINVQGGSACNLTALVLARNTVFSDVKEQGLSDPNVTIRSPILFVSSRAHYSFEKAAQICGLGSKAIVKVPVDHLGRMMPSALETSIVEAQSTGQTPFFVAATAGTTVMGAFDPLREVGDVARRHGLWFHIDAAWGGSFVFSDRLRDGRLDGSELANSIGYNPHKMLGVPAPCSLLLVQDLRQLHASNSLPAEYLYHGSYNVLPRNTQHYNQVSNELAQENVETIPVNGSNNSNSTTNSDIEGLSTRTSRSSLLDLQEDRNEWIEPDDLGDLTLQCGRRGDSLKLFLAWQYYGSQGFATRMERAHSNACYIAQRLATIEKQKFILVSPMPLSCLQVCFYFAPYGQLVHQMTKLEQGDSEQAFTNNARQHMSSINVGKLNSSITRAIAKALVHKGFMVDFAPAREGCQPDWHGEFFRLVVHIETVRETLDRLIDQIVVLGNELVVKQNGIQKDR